MLCCNLCQFKIQFCHHQIISNSHEKVLEQKHTAKLVTLARLVQLARRMCSSWEQGVVFPWLLPKGLMTEETALFSLLGVRLKLNARPTFFRVFEANLQTLMNLNFDPIRVTIWITWMPLTRFHWWHLSTQCPFELGQAAPKMSPVNKSQLIFCINETL